MLIYDVSAEEIINQLTLALSASEAEELVEKLTYLIKHREYHHDHLEDYENTSNLNVVVIQPDKLHTYDESFRDELSKVLKL